MSEIIIEEATIYASIMPHSHINSNFIKELHHSPKTSVTIKSTINKKLNFSPYQNP